MGERTAFERRPTRRSSAILAAVLATLGGLAMPAVAAPRGGLSVVELFTSQGCSSCPPANANAASLADRSDLLVLSFGVTYWDYLGWKDIFAKPEFTERQRTYEPALGEDGPFTPQVVVNGVHDTVGNHRDAIEALIAAGPPAKGPALTLGDGHLAIAAADRPGAPADIWLVHYDPRTIAVAVRRGENGGRTLPHRNVVRDLTRIGSWNGAPVALDLPKAEEGMRTAVLVQAPEGGPILAAATD